MEAARIHFDMLRNSVVKLLIEALEKNFLDFKYETEGCYPKFRPTFPAPAMTAGVFDKAFTENVAKSIKFYNKFIKYEHFYEDLVENHYPELTKLFKRYFETTRNFHNATKLLREAVEHEVANYLEKRGLKHVFIRGNQVDCFFVLDLVLGVCQLLRFLALIKNVKKLTKAEIKLLFRDMMGEVVEKEVVSAPADVGHPMYAVKVEAKTVYRSQDIKKVENAEKIIHDTISLIIDNDKVLNLAGEMVNAENVYFSEQKKLLGTLKKLYAMPVFKMEKEWLFIIKCPYVKPKIEVPKVNH